MTIQTVLDLCLQFQAADELFDFDPSIRGEFYKRYRALGRTIVRERKVNPLHLLGTGTTILFRLGPRSMFKYIELKAWLASQA